MVVIARESVCRDGNREHREKQRQPCEAKQPRRHPEYPSATLSTIRYSVCESSSPGVLLLLDEYLTGNYSLNLSVSTDEGGEHDDEQGSLIAAAYPVRRTPSVDGVPGRHLGHAWEGAHRPFRRLDMAHAPLDELAEDVEVDVGEATHVQAGLAGGVLPERSQ